MGSSLCAGLAAAAFIHEVNKGWKRMARLRLPKDEERFRFTPQTSQRTARLRKAI
jgi:hypothetical protein